MWTQTLQFARQVQEFLPRHHTATTVFDLTQARKCWQYVLFILLQLITETSRTCHTHEQQTPVAPSGGRWLVAAKLSPDPDTCMQKALCGRKQKLQIILKTNYSNLETW
ncbi:hypothetical protein CHARACLAT_032783 [Characodon lateralis]|uniref:Uncharacterized protein n=1 Tax=Characodon lateralis TaxID=208331 RepID=A0ABU7D2N2_9TELE|nr:hypothetical protein [Characodon lateralis]